MPSGDGLLFYFSGKYLNIRRHNLNIVQKMDSVVGKANAVNANKRVTISMKLNSTKRVELRI